MNLALRIRKILPYSIYKLLEMIQLYKTYYLATLIGGLKFRKFFGKDNKKLYPTMLIIGSTTRCNLNCTICDRHSFKVEDLKLYNLKKIESLIRGAEDINLTGYGEPLLNAEIDSIIEYIYSVNNRKNIISLVTNGTRLTEKFGALLSGRINNITISLNAATEETYRRDMKNAKLQDVLENITEFLSVLDDDSKNRIILSFVAHADNFKEIPDFIDLAFGLGVKKVRVGQFAIFREEDIRLSLLNVRGEYNRYIDLALKRANKSNIILYANKFDSPFNHNISKHVCFFPFKQLIINPDGSIDGPCCCGRFDFGNVFQEDFDNIWFGQNYMKMRKKRYLPTCITCRDFASFDSLEAHFCHEFLIPNRKKLSSLLKDGKGMG